MEMGLTRERGGWEEGVRWFLGFFSFFYFSPCLFPLLFCVSGSFRKKLAHSVVKPKAGKGLLGTDDR